MRAGDSGALQSALHSGRIQDSDAAKMGQAFLDAVADTATGNAVSQTGKRAAQPVHGPRAGMQGGRVPSRVATQGVLPRTLRERLTSARAARLSPTAARHARGRTGVGATGRTVCPPAPRYLRLLLG